MKLKIGSTYQKAVTIVEKLKEGQPQRLAEHRSRDDAQGRVLHALEDLALEGEILGDELVVEDNDLLYGVAEHEGGEVEQQLPTGNGESREPHEGCSDAEADTEDRIHVHNCYHELLQTLRTGALYRKTRGQTRFPWARRDFCGYPVKGSPSACR